MKARIQHAMALLASDDHLMRSDAVAAAVKTLAEVSAEIPCTPMNAGNQLAAAIVADDLTEAQSGAPAETPAKPVVLTMLEDQGRVLESVKKSLDELLAFVNRSA